MSASTERGLPGERQRLHIGPSHPLTNGSAELVFNSPHSDHLQDWSRDGRYLLFFIDDDETGRDLWYLERSDDGSWSEAKYWQCKHENKR